MVDITSWLPEQQKSFLCFDVFIHLLLCFSAHISADSFTATKKNGCKFTPQPNDLYTGVIALIHACVEMENRALCFFPLSKTLSLPHSLQTLLDLGASPDYKDSRGLTPLYHSAMVGGDPYCCELLLYDHAQLGYSDENGWQEIHQVAHTHLHTHTSIRSSLYLQRYGRLKHGSGVDP